MSKGSFLFNDKDKSVYVYVSSLSTFWVGQSTYSTLSIFCIISLSLSLCVSWKEKNENDCWCCAAANFNFFLLIIISIPMYVPRKHLSYIIHLHFDLLYIFREIKRKRPSKSNQANSYSISIHMSFLLSQHLARLFFYCCLFLFSYDVMPISVYEK